VPFWPDAPVVTGGKVFFRSDLVLNLVQTLAGYAGSSQKSVHSGPEAAGVEQAAGDVVGEVAEAVGVPRRCSSRPLIASVGPLLVLGRSK
jgi:hypothetical protein